MTDRETEPTESGLNRRAVLRGTAAAGLAGAAATGTASADDWKELRFQSAGDEIFRYRVSVNGRLERAPNRDGGDRLVDENTAEGAARGGNHDDWRFTGEITELRLGGPGKVFVDGKLVEDTTTDDPPHRIRLEAGDEPVSYQFRVSGRVEKTTADAGDRIRDGNVVSGGLAAGGTDEFRYAGDVAFAETDEELTVTLALNQ